MSAKSKAPGTQEKRFAAYLERLASAAGHADRHEPLKSYCTGLLLPIKRKSVEPMAARLAPDNVRRMHQSLHHLVADAPWDDAALLAEVRQYALGAMEANGPIEAWIVDDTGFVKKGTHSVGVARQYCGQVGKPENCRVAVSLSVATAKSSLPVAWRLYLPETWAKDPERRSKAAIPEDVRFQTKPQIALEQIRQAVDDGIAPAPVLGDTAYGNNYKFRHGITELDDGIAPAPVLGDTAYGNNYKFRHGITELGLSYVLGVQGTTTVWKPGQGPLPPKSLTGRGRTPTRMQRNKKHHDRFRSSNWPSRCLPSVGRTSPGAKAPPRPCVPVSPQFAFVPLIWITSATRRIRKSGCWSSGPRRSHPNRSGTGSPLLGPGAVHTSLSDLAGQAKQRWIIERDYQELKQELGLGHYEGRGWRGFHHHGTLCIASYGFLVAERSRFSPSAFVEHVGLSVPKLPKHFKPRGTPDPARTT